MKKIRMFTIKGKWIVRDGDRLVEFDSSYDAWQLILMLKEIRPRVPYIKPLYPVRSLNPIPERIKKTVTII